MLVVLVFFSIVTSIVVSFLLNVVSYIRFPTGIRGRLGLFPASPSLTVPTLPFQTMYEHTGIELCYCEERGACLTLTSSVDICQVPNLINYQLLTFGYQRLVDKKMTLSTLG